jgi:hypothetical protein
MRGPNSATVQPFQRKGATQQSEVEATKATARLRGLPSPGVINPPMSADGTPATTELDVWSPILFRHQRMGRFVVD